MTLAPNQLAVLFCHLFDPGTEELEPADLALELDLSGSPFGAVVIKTKAARVDKSQRRSSVSLAEDDVQIG